MRVAGGRFVTERVLKSGQGIVTWLAREDADPVILKMAPAEADLWIRLTHEAEVLGLLKTAGIPRLRGCGRSGDQLFVAADYVPGATLEERLRAGALEQNVAIQLAIDLLEILEEIHVHGVLHRDVKPSNVVLGDQKPVLIDFGLARSQRLHQGLGALPVGSVTYTAPELAGLTGHDVGEPADLYSLGTMLYHCLAGQPPFGGETVGQVLRQHLTTPVPRLSGLMAGLQAVLDRLLAKDPGQRYLSAKAACADLRAVQRGQPITLGSGEIRRHLAAPALVGREAELTSLTSLIGQAGLVVLSGPSGSGKSRLMDALALEAIATGAWVLRGQALHQTANIPLQLLAGPLYEVAHLADPELKARLLQRLGPLTATLLRAAPVLQSWLEEARGQDSETFTQAQALEALLALLNVLGSPACPAVLLLDDAQWADPLSHELLMALSRAGSPANLLVVVATRSEDAGLAALGCGHRIDLAPLDEKALRELVTSMAGSLPEEIWPTLLDYCDGNPFLIVETLRGFVEQGVLEPTETGWLLHPNDFQTSLRSSVTLQRKLEGMGPELFEILEAAATLGKVFSPGPLAKMAGRPVLAALEKARRARILWRTPDGLRFQFAHDRLRDALLAPLETVRRRRLHELAAEALSQDTMSSPFSMAFHYSESSQFEKAFPHALEAARQAKDRGEFATAAAHYRIALRGATEPVSVRELLAEALLRAGRFLEAQDEYLTLLNLCNRPLDRARILWWLSEVADRLGNAERCVVRLEGALRELGHGALLDATPFRSLPKIVWRFLRSPGQPPKAAAQTGPELSVQCLYKLSQQEVFRGKTAVAFMRHVQALEVAEVGAAGAQLGFIWNLHGTILTQMPAAFRRNARRYLEVGSERVHKDGGPAWMVAQCQANTMFYRWSTEPLSSILPDYKTVRETLVRTGDWHERAMFLYVSAFALAAGGCFDLLEPQAQEAFRTSTALSYPRGRAIGLNAWARARGGEIPRNLIETELSRCDEQDPFGAMQLRTASAMHFLAAGLVERAIEQLKHEPTSGLPVELANFRTWQAHVLRVASEKLPPRAIKQKQLLLARAARATRLACRLAQSHLPLLLTFAYREEALLSALRGQSKRAERYFERSLELAVRLEHHYEAALTRMERARYRLELGQTESREEYEMALLELGRLGATWHLREDPELRRPEALLPAPAAQFDGLLKWGRVIAATTDAGQLAKQLREAVLELLSAEDCLVLSWPALEYKVGKPQRVSRTLIDEAVATRRAATVDPRTTIESVVFAQVRSLMACPITVDGRCELVVYLFHPVGGIFGVDELRLVEFLCALAGAASESCQANLRFEGVFRSAGVGLALLNPEGTIEACNPALRDLLNCNEPRRISDHIYPLDHAALTTRSSEVRVTREDGHVLWCQLTRTELEGRALITLADITHRRLEMLTRFQEDERRLLSTELHDGISQPMVALHLKLELLRCQYPTAIADEASKMASDLLRDVGQLIYSLRNPCTEGQSVFEAIRTHLEWFERETGIQVESSFPDGALVPGIASQFAFRIVQEALSNVRRHSGARRVTLAFEIASNGLNGMILDNGRGFVEGAEAEGRFGLKGMRFRAELLGGGAWITSLPQRGTEVRFVLPVG